MYKGHPKPVEEPSSYHRISLLDGASRKTSAQRNGGEDEQLFVPTWPWQGNDGRSGRGVKNCGRSGQGGGPGQAPECAGHP